MAWVTPKTNWVDGDRFNLDPDYNRIKGNIEHLIEMSRDMYPEYEHPQLESASMDGYPQLSFFNNVVNATWAMLYYCYSPNGSNGMREYSSNGAVWNASELNAIENNHQLLYDAFTAQKPCIRRLQITLGGVKIGC